MSVSLDMSRERLSKSLIEEIEDDFYEVPFFALGSECELYFSAAKFELAQVFCGRVPLSGWRSLRPDSRAFCRTARSAGSMPMQVSNGRTFILKNRRVA